MLPRAKAYIASERRLITRPRYSAPVVRSKAVSRNTYEEVCSETTGHAEVSRVEFDSSQISYDELLSVFFSTHVPTTLNRQGADRGTQYRSIIFYASDDQKERATSFVKELENTGGLSSSIVTEIVPLEMFYEAESAHKDFYLKNSSSMYCQIVINPKLAKVREKFAKQLR